MSARTDITLGTHVTIEDGAILGRVAVRGMTARDPGPPAPVQIGAGSHIGCHAVIYAGCVIGERCLIGDGASLYVGVQLGAAVRIGRQVTINYGATIGDDTVIMDGTHITGLARVGRGCFIGPNVTTMNDREPRQPYDAARLAPCTIGDGVLIGGGAVIGPGVTIGDGAKVGAGAVVLRDVPAGATVLPMLARQLDGGV